MNLTEKIAYIKGLAEGLELDTTTKEGKVLNAIIDLLEDMVDEIDAIDEAMVTLTDNKVPLSRAILFVTPRTALAINKNITRSTANGEGAINNIVNSYNNVPVIVVPQDRFYTGIELLPGTGEDQFGYEKAADAKEINFLGQFL
mgnify:CR=1 FL=1